MQVRRAIRILAMAQLILDGFSRKEVAAHYGISTHQLWRDLLDHKKLARWYGQHYTPRTETDPDKIEQAWLQHELQHAQQQARRKRKPSLCYNNQRRVVWIGKERFVVHPKETKRQTIAAMVQV